MKNKKDIVYWNDAIITLSNKQQTQKLNKMYVKILKSESTDYWYAGRIGEIFEVSSIPNPESPDDWCVIPTGDYIVKTDCIVVTNEEIELLSQPTKEQYDEIFFAKMEEYNTAKDFNDHVLLINDKIMLISMDSKYKRWDYTIIKIDEIIKL